MDPFNPLKTDFVYSYGGGEVGLGGLISMESMTSVINLTCNLCDVTTSCNRMYGIKLIFPLFCCISEDVYTILHSTIDVNLLLLA